DDDRSAGANEEFIHRESIVSESIVAVLRYSNVSGGDQGGELLPETGHLAISGFSVLTHNACDQRLATLREPHHPILSRVRCIALFGDYLLARRIWSTQSRRPSTTKRSAPFLVTMRSPFGITQAVEHA
ncbi:MAG: hypothetical protein ACKOEM_13370, partial [Planctomycetia bacterium]